MIGLTLGVVEALDCCTPDADERKGSKTLDSILVHKHRHVSPLLSKYLRSHVLNRTFSITSRYSSQFISMCIAFVLTELICGREKGITWFQTYLIKIFSQNVSTILRTVFSAELNCSYLPSSITQNYIKG